MTLSVDATDAGLAALAARHGLHPRGDRVGIVVHEADGHLLAANQAGLDMLAVDRENLRERWLGDARWAVINDAGHFLDIADYPVARALARREPVSNFVLGIHRATVDRPGEHLWVTVSTVPLMGTQGEAPLAAISLLEVLEPPRQQWLRLQQSERLFRVLVEDSSDMVAVLTPDRTYLWVSPQCEQILGYRPDELVGHQSLEFLHPDDIRTALSATAAEAVGEPVEPVTVRMQHTDGHWVWVETCVRAVRGVDGSPARIHLATRDATKRVRAERERDRALVELREIIERAPTAMAVLTMDLVPVHLNHALCDLLGFDEDDLGHQSFIDLTHPDDRGETLRQYDELRAGRCTAATCEKRFLRGDGSIVWAERTATRIQPTDDMPCLFIAQFIDITARKRAQDELTGLALTDALTGLPNRLVLSDRLSHALAVARRNHARVGVIYLDLDWFKQVNDTFGHDAGDEVLRQVAIRLRETVREDDTTVRLGGDEFVVICENVIDTGPVLRLADRIRVAIDMPYHLDEHLATVSASIGVAVGDATSAEELLQRADTTMYRAKRAGGARVDVYDPSIGAESAHRLALHDELAGGLDRGELALFYQPIVRLPQGQTIGREALLRWLHPTRGLMSPDHFFGALEQSRLVGRIGDWVIDRACSEAAQWNDDTLVCVNVSPRHLAAEGFVDSVRRALDFSGLPPWRLCLEIIESSVLHASPTTLAATRVLTGMGVHFGLDDFGTGYSSITALHRLPIAHLKIDRSFIADLPSNEHAANLVDGLIRLGVGMEIEVIAEGVETPEQAAWLSGHGCAYGQGFLYGRPQPRTSG